LDVVFGTLQDTEKRETRFTSTRSAKEIISTIEEAAKPLGFNVQKSDYQMKLQGDKNGRKGHLSVATQVWSCCYHSCRIISDVTKL
jgi:5'-AMP-activated protein kinase catalytic alpha subunit